jgi:hypothetical protein
MASISRSETRGQTWWTVGMALVVVASWLGISGVALLR